MCDKLTQSAGVSKGLVADIAYERFFVAVDKHVLRESLFRRKALVARGTNMGFVYGTFLVRVEGGAKVIAQLTANMSLHVSLDLAPLGEPCGSGLAAWTVVPAATEALDPFLSMLDVSF